MNLYTTIITLLFFCSVNAQDVFSYTREKLEEGVITERGEFLKLSDYVIKYSDGTPDELFENPKFGLKKISFTLRT